MARCSRQIKILDLISKKTIETQDDLAIELQQAGFEVTQATISRDIKELGIIKISSDGKRQKYAREVADRNFNNKIISIFKHAVISIDNAMNIVVIKTLSGSANSAGMMIDKLENLDILGCVAGDDTVMVIARNPNVAQQIVEELNTIINE